MRSSLVNSNQAARRYMSALGPKAYIGPSHPHSRPASWEKPDSRSKVPAPALLPLEDAIDIGRKLEMMARLTSVGQQTAGLSEETPRTDGWQTVASSQRDDLHAMDIHEAMSNMEMSSAPDIRRRPHRA